MSNIYIDFGHAWLCRAIHGINFAGGLHDARLRMEGHPHYDPTKHRAVLDAAVAILNATRAPT
jgi:hypothetical protein